MALFYRQDMLGKDSPLFLAWHVGINGCKRMSRAKVQAVDIPATCKEIGEAQLAARITGTLMKGICLIHLTKCRAILAAAETLRTNCRIRFVTDVAAVTKKRGLVAKPTAITLRDGDDSEDEDFLLMDPDCFAAFQSDQQDTDAEQDETEALWTGGFFTLSEQERSSLFLDDDVVSESELVDHKRYQVASQDLIQLITPDKGRPVTPLSSLTTTPEDVFDTMAADALAETALSIARTEDDDPLTHIHPSPAFSRTRPHTPRRQTLSPRQNNGKGGRRDSISPSRDHTSAVSKHAGTGRREALGVTMSGVVDGGSAAIVQQPGDNAQHCRSEGGQGTTSTTSNSGGGSGDGDNDANRAAGNSQYHRGSDRAAERGGDNGDDRNGADDSDGFGSDGDEDQARDLDGSVVSSPHSAAGSPPGASAAGIPCAHDGSTVPSPSPLLSGPSSPAAASAAAGAGSPRSETPEILRTKQRHRHRLKFDTAIALSDQAMLQQTMAEAWERHHLRPHISHAMPLSKPLRARRAVQELATLPTRPLRGAGQKLHRRLSEGLLILKKRFADKATASLLDSDDDNDADDESQGSDVEEGDAEGQQQAVQDEEDEEADHSGDEDDGSHAGSDTGAGAAGAAEDNDGIPGSGLDQVQDLELGRASPTSSPRSIPLPWQSPAFSLTGAQSIERARASLRASLAPSDSGGEGDAQEGTSTPARARSLSAVFDAAAASEQGVFGPSDQRGEAEDLLGVAPLDASSELGDTVPGEAVQETVHALDTITQDGKEFLGYLTELGEAQQSAVQFDQLLGPRPTKYIAASGLSNLLHLAGAGVLSVHQTEAFGSIDITGNWATTDTETRP